MTYTKEVVDKTLTRYPFLALHPGDHITIDANDDLTRKIRASLQYLYRNGNYRTKRVDGTLHIWRIK